MGLRRLKRVFVAYNGLYRVSAGFRWLEWVFVGQNGLYWVKAGSGG